MDIHQLKLEMDNKLGMLERKLDQILSVLRGDDLANDGGMIKKVKDLEDKARDYEFFKSQIKTTWSTVAIGSGFLGVVIGLLIAYFHK